jgi:5-methylcytosine-specific restriction endonuclease McrA
MAHSDDIRASLIKLTTEDNTFIDAITSATGDKNKTQFRFELWHETLKEIVTTPTQSRSFDGELKRQLFSANNECAICKQVIHSIDDAHLDHTTPFSKGGTTTNSNAQITHRYCNLRKSDK